MKCLKSQEKVETQLDVVNLNLLIGIITDYFHMYEAMLRTPCYVTR